MSRRRGDYQQSLSTTERAHRYHVRNAGQVMRFASLRVAVPLLTIVATVCAESSWCCESAASHQPQNDQDTLGLTSRSRSCCGQTKSSNRACLTNAAGSSGQQSASPAARCPRPTARAGPYAPGSGLLARHRRRRRRDAPPGLRPPVDAVRRPRLARDVLHDGHGALADQRNQHRVGSARPGTRRSGRRGRC